MTGVLLAAAAVMTVVNGEFEDRSKIGRIDEFAEIRENCGVVGSAGLRLRPSGLKSGTFQFATDFKPEYGRKYVFSLLRKTHGQMNVYMAWQVWGKGWCLGQSWNTAVTPADGGWEKQEIIFSLKEKEWENAEVRFLVKAETPGGKPADTQAWVDYDSATIREGEPEWHFANVWPTHGMLFNEKGRMRFHSAFIGRFLPEGGEAAYRLSLRRPDGKTLAQNTVKPSAESFTVEFGPLDYQGPAEVEVLIADAVSKKQCGVKKLSVTVGPACKPKPGEVFITENGDTLIDGKPFMPLGFFTGLGRGNDLEKARREFKKIHDAGFNCVMEYWMNTWQNRGLKEFYDALRDNDLRILYNFSDCYRGKTEDHIGRAKKQLANGAPLLGWYILDEAELTHLPAIKAFRKELNRLTPGLPAWQVNIRDLEPFLDAADVLGGDHYLIGRQMGVLKQMDKYLTSAEACGAATMWYCPQCFNWANYDKEAKLSREKYLKEEEPTVNQMLAIAFLYASHSVKGFVFYMYDDIFTGPVPERYEKRWEDVKEVGRAMKSLEPFVISGKPIEVLPVTDVKGKTRAVALSDGKGAWRVLVIGLDYENGATFELPAKCATLRPSFGKVTVENGKCRFKAGTRSCDLLK